MIDERFTIVNEQQFIEATRSRGYKSTCSAMAELVDNAFQADAHQIDVRIIKNDEHNGLNMFASTTGAGWTLRPSGKQCDSGVQRDLTTEVDWGDSAWDCRMLL